MEKGERAMTTAFLFLAFAAVMFLAFAIGGLIADALCRWRERTGMSVGEVAALIDWQDEIYDDGRSIGQCPVCGGEARLTEARWQCEYCNVLDDERAEQHHG